MTAELSLAEQRANERGLPVLALPTFDLIHAAQGHPMIVSTLDGTEMLLRLMTAEEARDTQWAAAEAVADQTGVEPVMITLDRAAELVRPIPGGRS